MNLVLKNIEEIKMGGKEDGEKKLEMIQNRKKTEIPNININEKTIVMCRRQNKIWKVEEEQMRKIYETENKDKGKEG